MATTTRDLPTRWVIAAVALAAVLALWVTNLLFADDDVGDGVTSTYSEGIPGGATLSPVSATQLPLASDVAVRASIIDVKPARLTTTDGEYPPLDPKAGPQQRFGINIVTPVIVRIDEVIGIRPELSASGHRLLDGLSVGDLVKVTVAGGAYSYVVSPEEARILGIKVVPDAEAEYFPDPDGDSPASPSERGLAEDELEAFPTEPLTVVAGMAPGVDLVEGDVAILFLSAHTDPGLDDVIHIVGAGQGVFLIDSEAVTRALPGTPTDLLSLADVEAIARSLNTATGVPLDVAQVADPRP